VRSRSERVARTACANRLPIALAAVVAILCEAADGGSTAAPRNFIFFGRERDRIVETSFLENPQIAGAQLKYTWRELEPARDRYEFGTLLEDLAFLECHGKRLFVQLQDVSFSEEIPVPTYLQTDPTFNGGAARKYESEGDDESSEKFDGWVARRWDPAVRARFNKLLGALGAAVDGRIEDLNLAETAIGFGESGKRHPAGFTYPGYVEGTKELMASAWAVRTCSRTAKGSNNTATHSSRLAARRFRRGLRCRTATSRTSIPRREGP
jgi:hypothetical protein